MRQPPLKDSHPLRAFVRTLRQIGRPRVTKTNIPAVVKHGASGPIDSVDLAARIAAGAPNYWNRSGTTLSPTTAGDDLMVDTIIGGSGAGDTLLLSGTSHATPGVVRVIGGSQFSVVASYAGDLVYLQNSSNAANSAALHIDNFATSGGTLGLFVESADVSGIGILAQHIAATGAVHSIEGTTLSSDNAAYGGYFDQTHLGDYADLVEGAAPATPPTNKWRFYAKTDGLYYKDDAGAETGPLASASGSYTFTAAGDSGTPQTISSGNTLTIAGGTGCSTTAGATDTVTIDVDTQTSALLSTTHTDTTAAAPTRGDIISAQGASPKWAALAKGSLGDVLTMGANEPAWSAPSGGVWTRTGTDLIPTTADDDVLLHDASWLKWGDGNPGTAEIGLYRGAADRLELDSTNYFRMLGLSGTPASPVYGNFSYDTSQQTYRFFEQSASAAAGGGHDLSLVGLHTAKSSPTSVAYGTVTNTETVIASATIQGESNFPWVVGKCLRVRAWGIITTGTAAGDQMTWRLRCGGVAGTLLVATSALGLPNSLTDAMWRSEIDLVVTAIGASTASFQPQGETRLYSTVAGATNLSMSTNAAVACTVNADTTLDLTVQFSNVSTNDVITCTNFTLEILN